MELIIKDLMKFYCCSENTARQRKREILRYFKLPEDRQRITALHISKYENLPLSDVIAQILM